MKIRIENKYINPKSNSKYIKVNQLYVKKKMINNKILQKNAEDLKTNIIKLDARLNVIPYINKYHNRYFKKKGSELSPKSYTDGNKKFNPQLFAFPGWKTLHCLLYKTTRYCTLNLSHRSRFIQNGEKP